MSPHHDRTSSLPKRVLFVLVLVALGWGCIEVTALGLHFATSGHLFPKSTIKRDMRMAIRMPLGGGPRPVDGGGLVWGEAGFDWGNIVEIIHPYLGFVLDPERNSIAVSDLGFVGQPDGDGLTRREKGQYVVGVFGGSFASGSAHYVAEALASCSALGDREVVVGNYALPGYKQPQQLFALSYLLMLGAEFDLIVNLDGFNEVALPPVENLDRGVHPYHPRSWHLRASTLYSSNTLRAAGRVEFLREMRDRWARPFVDFNLYRSPALSLIWRIGDATLSRQARVDEERVALATPVAGGYAVTGPTWPAAKGDSDESRRQNLMSALVEGWARSSEQMQALADAEEIQYVHLLQPNQYVSGSKPMGLEERALALGEGPYADGARDGYRLLIERGRALRDRGMTFLDLTQVYSKIEEPLYIDSCCHVNAAGYRRVVEQICQTIGRTSFEIE